ncbi:MAG: leucine-rich repeat protein, partial [Bacilli bacterium]|nr:leucine-rich repeat protein [Bacilli bacterium]
SLYRLTNIGDNAFSNTFLTDINLSGVSQLKYIGPYAFYKIQSNSVNLVLGSKLLLNTLGVNAFCETNYNLVGDYEINNSISVDSLTSACIN